MRIKCKRNFQLAEEIYVEMKFFQKPGFSCGISAIFRCKTKVFDALLQVSCHCETRAHTSVCANVIKLGPTEKYK